MKTKIINYFGGPGVGKSTDSAALYVEMKRAGYDVELVREVAKKYAHKGQNIGAFDQIAIIGQQIEEESSLIGNVEYVITDGPSFLCAIYLYTNHDKYFMMDSVKKYYEYCQQKGVIFKNFVIPRTKEYNPKGRFEDEFTANFIDSLVRVQLTKYDIPYTVKNPTIKDVIYEKK